MMLYYLMKKKILKYKRNNYEGFYKMSDEKKEFIKKVNDCLTPNY